MLIFNYIVYTGGKEVCTLNFDPADLQAIIDFIGVKAAAEGMQSHFLIP